MDKKRIEGRLENMEQMKENHLQDLLEFEFVIEGLRNQLSNMPEEVIEEPKDEETVLEEKPVEE